MARHPQPTNLERILVQRIQPRIPAIVGVINPNPQETNLIRITGLARAVGVRPHPTAPGQYELLAGRPHWLAAVRAGLNHIPAQVNRAPNLQAALDALTDLIRHPITRPIALADTLHQLLRLIPIATHEDLGLLSGLARNAVTHFLLLRELPAPVRNLLAQGRLTVGHGKALGSRALRADPERQLELAHRAIRERWSVHQLAREARGRGNSADHGRDEGAVKKSLPGASPQVQTLVPDPNISQLAVSLSQKTGMPVKIEHEANGAGRIIFQYFSLDETDNLLRFIPLEQ